ncbi:DHA2 family efflux MFS transporter permease subunit [Fodinicola acaciae]|uniref:DHA2 family efflux MFS transporter permease subunit n=1 Tax=Fodinicola acaciae TaxID=2681555 RepID=UPI0013D1737A|nr:DHA2 family efflux MFS transporter permease subunit [Fodinicola acaciae]
MDVSSVVRSRTGVVGWGVLPLLVAAQFVLVVDSSIVNIALPSMRSDLHLSNEELSWTVNAYVLAFGGFLLLGGRLADLLGRRRMFVIGLALFTMASLAGGFAQSSAWLFGARAAQGLGAAITSPAALSLLSTIFVEGKARDRAMGVWGAAVGAGGAFGVLLGGVITSGLGWRWVLFINVPVGVAVIALAPIVLPAVATTGRDRIDVVGAVLVTGCLGVLVWALVDIPRLGWASSDFFVRVGVAIVLGVAFIVVEARSRHPLVPFSIFGIRSVSAANALNFMLSMTLLAMFYFISLYLQEVLRLSAVLTGLAYLPLTVGITVASQLAGRIGNRVDLKYVTVAGLGVLGCGLLWFSRLRPEGGYLLDVLGPSILCGVGMGCALVGLTITAMSGTSPGQAGLASGVLTTTQQIGGALGLAVTSTIAASVSNGGDSAHDMGAHDIESLTNGYGASFLLAACLSVVTAVAAIWLLRPTRERRAIDTFN